jgi:hypothetical protein
MLPKWLIAATSGVLGAAGWGLIEWLAPDKSQWCIPARLLLLTAIGVVLLYLVLGLLYLRLWLHSRKRQAFGVLWDSHKQPICASCDGPLSIHFESSFKCPSCKIEIRPHDEKGQWISAKEAMAKMNK